MVCLLICSVNMRCGSYGRWDVFSRISGVINGAHRELTGKFLGVNFNFNTTFSIFSLFFFSFCPFVPCKVLVNPFPGNFSWNFPIEIYKSFSNSFTISTKLKMKIRKLWKRIQKNFPPVWIGINLILFIDKDTKNSFRFSLEITLRKTMNFWTVLTRTKKVLRPWNQKV